MVKLHKMQCPTCHKRWHNTSGIGPMCLGGAGHSGMPERRYGGGPMGTAKLSGPANIFSN